MQLITRLNEIIAERHLLKHEFYQLWNKGELSREALQHYAAQYYSQVASFPRFISGVHHRCEKLDVRVMLTENLADEELHGIPHPELWMQFAEGLGLSSEQVQNAKPLPQTKALVDKFYELAKRDWRDGLCALYAYESQVPAISTSKIAGLIEHYGISDEKTLKFFSEHEHYDVGHSKRVAEFIERYVDQEQAERATKEAAEAQWQFLDGICLAENIACH
jgi:pyrroloquinoline-quinone synthase